MTPDWDRLADDRDRTRAHPAGPYAQEPPEAVCLGCDSGWQDGPFYEDWVSDSGNFERDDDGSIIIHHPKECPNCKENPA